MRAEILWPRQTLYIPVMPTPKQAAFLLLPHLEALFGGAAGGGKSVALLAGALQYVDIPGYSALIIRKTYKSLEQPGGLIDVAKHWLGPTDAVWRESHDTCRFPSGATLTFRHLQDELGLQGAEYQYIGIDELTELDEDIYLFLFSRLRAKSGSAVPLRMRATATPYGPGAEWVYRRYVESGSVPDRAFIRSLPNDNPHLDNEGYDRTLAQLPEIVQQRLRNGRWDLRPDGGLFHRDWFEGHWIDAARLPEHLRLCRYWDLAATEVGPGRDPDYTVGVLLGRDPDGICYVVDVVRGRRTPLKVQQMVADTAAADRVHAYHRGWPPPAIRMEQEPGASGVASIDTYRREVLPEYDFAGVRTKESKESRARPISVRAEQGQILLVLGPWNGSFVDELCAFPYGGHDDQVDAVSGAYAHLAGGRRRHARVTRVRFFNE